MFSFSIQLVSLFAQESTIKQIKKKIGQSSRSSSIQKSEIKGADRKKYTFIFWYSNEKVYMFPLHWHPLTFELRCLVSVFDKFSSSFLFLIYSYINFLIFQLYTWFLIFWKNYILQVLDRQTDRRKAWQH